MISIIRTFPEHYPLDPTGRVEVRSCTGRKEDRTSDKSGRRGHSKLASIYLIQTYTKAMRTQPATSVA